MTKKSTKDPAGLLPSWGVIDCDNIRPGDYEKIRGSMEYCRPPAQIERLRRHPALVELADELVGDLAPDGSASEKLQLRIANAEYRALYLDAAPAVIEKIRRKKSKFKNTCEEIDTALSNHDGNRTHAAKELKVTSRNLRLRIAQEDALAKWRKG